MKRVEGVEDLNSRIICAQGIVGVGAIIRTCIASSPVAVCRQTAATVLESEQISDVAVQPLGP